jgi:hypothetical protein
VIRRCPAPLTMIVAALAISLGSRPMSTRADAISTTTYELTNTAAIPASGNISVEAIVSPTGGVVTLPAVNGVVPNPLTPVSLPAGLNADELVDGLKTATGSNGQPEQLFGLEFGQGLPANSAFTFTLTTNGSLSTAPQLISQTPGVTINTVSFSPSGSTPIADGGGGGGGPTNPNVPEPLSLLIWSALACAGLWRVRAQHRSQPVAL